MLKVGDEVARIRDGKVYDICKIWQVGKYFIRTNSADGAGWDLKAVEGRHYDYINPGERIPGNPYAGEYIRLATQRDRDEFAWTELRNEVAKVNWDQLPVETLQKVVNAVRKCGARVKPRGADW